MTKEEYLLDTLEYYSADPENRRCMDGKNCVYSPTTARNKLTEGCAIGRKLPAEVAYIYDHMRDGEGIAIRTLFSNFPLLKSKAPVWMQEMKLDFLAEVQLLHDAPTNWNNEGLTASGTVHLKGIMRQFDLEVDKFSKFL